MPFGVFAEDVVDSSGGLIDEIMSDQIERLGEFDPSQLLNEPVILQSLPVGIEPGVVGEELFLEGFGEIELLAGADLIGEAVWKNDLVMVSGSLGTVSLPRKEYLGAGASDDLEWSVMLLETFCNGLCASSVPRPLGTQAFLGECNDRKSFEWLFDSEE